MLTARLWWPWVIAELGREGIWCLDAAAAGRLLRAVVPLSAVPARAAAGRSAHKPFNQIVAHTF